jgi:prepilin peptidase CpaA
MAFQAIPRGLEVVLLAVALCAAVYDVRYRRIPNWLTVGGALAGVILNMVVRRPVPGLWFSLQGLLLGFGVYLVFYILHFMRAGDVKLMGAVGALAGPADWFGIFLASAIAGGVMALVHVLLKNRLKQTFWNIGFLLSQMGRGRSAYLEREELDVRSEKALRNPHGSAIAVGTIVFLAWITHFTQ